MASEWKQTLDFVQQLARRAGDVVMHYYEGDYEIADKGGQPVTDADHAANTLIVDALRERFPDDAILAEETPVEDDTWRRAERCWVIDPLDGTSDFVKGREGFCVMIGLLVDGRPKLGVVRVPVPDRTFLGVVGEGAWELHDGERRPLATSDRATGPELRVIASIAHRDAALDRALTALEPAETLSVGSVGYKVGHIAADQADVYVATTHHTSLWDTCAPEAILRAAGGDWVDLDGQPLDYRGPSLNHLRGLVATNGAATEDVVARLAGKFPVLD
jgi:3'(2'), 5'-bisphosphate nucleotidase